MRRGLFSHEKAGTIEGCDLSESNLDWVLFSNCDMGTLVLPGWPHFTLLDPEKVARSLPQGLDEELDILIEIASGVQPLSRGLTLDAKRFLRESTLDEESLRAVLSSSASIQL